MSTSAIRRITIAVACSSLLLSSTAAAAPIASQALNPWSALSAMGSQASQTALCATSTAAAAAQAMPTTRGCVLPVTDAAPAPLPTTPPPLAAQPAAGGSGLGFSPLLLALGVLAVVGLIALGQGDDDDDDLIPVTPD